MPEPLTLESHKPTPGLAFVALVNALCRMELAERINLIDFWADKDLNLYASVICGGQDGH